MFDHIAIEAADYPACRAFYETALAPLGIKVVAELGEATTVFGSPADRKPVFIVNGRGRPATTGLHLAFAASSRDAVDAFHAAGLAAGGTDNGGPGPRPVYHPDYYGAFVIDLDGNNVEAVCLTTEG